MVYSPTRDLKRSQTPPLLIIKHWNTCPTFLGGVVYLKFTAVLAFVLLCLWMEKVTLNLKQRHLSQQTILWRKKKKTHKSLCFSWLNCSYQNYVCLAVWELISVDPKPPSLSTDRLVKDDTLGDSDSSSRVKPQIKFSLRSSLIHRLYLFIRVWNTRHSINLYF